MKNPSFSTPSYQFINYAEMNSDDNKEIFAMRNSDLIAKWMVNSEPISFEDHQKFLNSLISRVDKDYFIVKNNEGKIIGSVNIDYSETGESERGIFINPKYWGRNLALKILKEFYDALKCGFGVKAILTRVKRDNIASIRLENKLGAEKIAEVGEYLFFKLKMR